MACGFFTLALLKLLCRKDLAVRVGKGRFSDRAIFEQAAKLPRAREIEARGTQDTADDNASAAMVKNYMAFR